MSTTDAMHRARAYFAGMAVLLGLISLFADAAHAPLLVGVALTVALLLVPLVLAWLPHLASRIVARPGRARSPGVILTSTHPDAAGHARPRAPGATAVAPA